MAVILFLIAAFFWLGSVLSASLDVKILGYWYAVIFNNAGYLTLVVHNVTSS